MKHKLFVSVLFFCISPIIFSQVVYENLWVPNSTVLATACSGNTIYIGGAFTQIGPSTGCGASINLETGLPDLTFAKVNGSVGAVEADGSGGWYIGGYFTKVGGVPRSILAHINADGSLDESWKPVVTGSNPIIWSIKISGSKIFIAGKFSSINGVTRNNIAAFDMTSGQLIENWICNANDQVFTLAVSNSILYAGGLFTDVGGLTRNYLAAINTNTGVVDLNWNPNANNRVYTIAVNGSLVYVGGQFTEVGSQSPKPVINMLD